MGAATTGVESSVGADDMSTALPHVAQKRLLSGISTLQPGQTMKPVV
ncbi:MAG TPA: hypothetical protein VKG84_10670 [Candidatus Acidoferrales bacterium]|nr:hypothetical protein [Candidatus Acidoferrales bacterium]